MSQIEKTFFKVLSAQSDASIQFDELKNFLTRLGFFCRTKGDHFIFWREGVEEIVNLQPKGKMAKPYQVKQVRLLILKYKLGGEYAQI